jgi:hypothetical protein
MPIEMVICTGTPDYIVSRFDYKKWNLRDDLWEKHRCIILCIAQRIIDSWIDFRKRPVRHVCLMGHTDFDGHGDYNIQLGRARANSVRDELCRALTYLAECRRRLDILTQITIAAGTAGKTSPRDLKKTDEARERNRRVEVFLLYTPSDDGRKCPVTQPIPPRRQQDPIII